MKTIAVLVLPASLLVACGHPATQRECEEIAERVALLELKQSVVGQDPGIVKDEVAKTKSWVRETSLKDCVGKRITDGAMGCVRQAKTAQEIVEKCFK